MGFLRVLFRSFVCLFVCLFVGGVVVFVCWGVCLFVGVFVGDMFVCLLFVCWDVGCLFV